MGTERTIRSHLEGQEIELSERIGQHFLIDSHIIDRLKSTVITGATVIEVGSGIGHVTEALSERAGSVVGIEIDKRFQPSLEELQTRQPIVSIIFGDALRISFKKLINRDEETQIIANLPFHITEPFMHKLIDLPVTNVTLMVGDSVAREIQESEESMGFGKLSLLTQTFFNISIAEQVSRGSFYPQPRTDAAIVELDPKSKKEINSNPPNYIFAYLFRNAEKYGLVVNDMKQAIVEASQYSKNSNLSNSDTHRKNRASVRRELKQMLKTYNSTQDITVFLAPGKNGQSLILSQSQALEVIGRMKISERTLNKPFFRLNNQDIRELVKSVKSFYHSKAKYSKKL